MHMSFVSALLQLALSFQLAEARKPFNMTLLHIIPFRLNGLSLQGSMDSAQLVVDVANNRSDILPDYHITLDFQNEDKQSGYSTGAAPLQELLEFTKSFDDMASSGTYQAPIVVGPFNSNGCKAMGPIVHHLNMVQLSSLCRSPLLVNRQAYPNLYLTVSSNQFLAKAQAALFKQVGNWKRIGIIVYAAMVANYMTGLYVNRYAQLNGIEVASFNAIYNDPDDTIKEMLDRDVRVISVNIADGGVLYKFYCRAYALGLTGPKYVFIDDTVQAVDPLTNSACAGSKLVEQFKYIVWGSQALESPNKKWESEFGYTPVDLDRMLGVDDTNRNNYTYKHRAVVHDAVLQALYALHDTDLELRQKHNLTLRNFSTHAELGMKVANSSVLNINRAGIRGTMRYTASGSNEFDTILFSYWTSSGMQNYFVTDVANGFESMAIRSIMEFPWRAWNRNGLPPRDQALLIREVSDVPTVALIVVSLFACLSTIAVVVAICSLRFKRRQIFAVGKIIGYSGCIVLNAAAVSFTLPKDWNPQALGIIRLVFLVVGVTVCTGVVSFRSIVHARDLRKRVKLGKVILAPRVSINQAGTRLTTQGLHGQTALATKPRMILPAADHENNEKNSSYLSLIFLLINGAITAGWLGGDSFRCALVRLFDESFYDVASDTYTEISAYMCESANQIAWIAALLGLNIAILGYGLHQAYHLTKLSKVSDEPVPEFVGMILGVVNATAIFVGVFFIVIILHTQPRQEIVIAVGAVILATTTMITWCYKAFARNTPVTPQV